LYFVVIVQISLVGCVIINALDLTLERTLWMLARDPLSVVVVTSKVAAESCVDAAVVVHCTVHNVRIRTALSWNGRGVLVFMTNHH